MAAENFEMTREKNMGDKGGKKDKKKSEKQSDDKHQKKEKDKFEKQHKDDILPELVKKKSN